MKRVDFSVVVVEDDGALRSEIAHLIGSAGFRVFQVACAEELDELTLQMVPSLLVLDVGLPGEDGLAICRRYTESIPGVFAVVLTARTAPADRICAYRGGAGIFLAKPFDGDELLAIVEGRYRWAERQQNVSGPSLILHGMTLRGPLGRISLTPGEARLLGAFAVAPGRALEAFRISEVLLLGEGTVMSKGAIELSVSRLRGKLRRVFEEPQPIRAIYRFGYKLVPAIELAEPAR
jgi:DNA-binding response OmpR family regulator